MRYILCVDGQLVLVTPSRCVYKAGVGIMPVEGESDNGVRYPINQHTLVTQVWAPTMEADDEHTNSAAGQ